VYCIEEQLIGKLTFRQQLPKMQNDHLIFHSVVSHQFSNCSPYQEHPKQAKNLISQPVLWGQTSNTCSYREVAKRVFSLPEGRLLDRTI